MMDSSGIWNGQDPTLSVPPEDDFQFLDLGVGNLNDALQFEFQDFHRQQGQDTTMQEHITTMTTAPSYPTVPEAIMNDHALNNDSLGELDAQIQYLQHQRYQQQQRQFHEQQRNYYVQNRVIPPTPNSIEMQGASSQFYPRSDPQQQAMYEGYRMQMKEQEVSMLLPHKIRITHADVDGLHSSSFTRRDTYRVTFRYSRIYGAWRIFQPFELPSSACTKRAVYDI